MELGLTLAICVFNSGYDVLAKSLFGALSIPLSHTALDSFGDLDNSRIYLSVYKTGQQRVKNINRKHARQEAFKKSEGIHYKSGSSHRAPRKSNHCFKLIKGSGHKRGQPCPFM